MFALVKMRGLQCLSKNGTNYQSQCLASLFKQNLHSTCQAKSMLQPSYNEESSVSQWQSVIGLEIHAQIRSNSKLFSAAGTSYGGSTNSQVSHFDAALPGTLPVINHRCVEAGVMTALALGCQVNPISLFDRKHYFYADMPAGYQITQQRQPLAVGGEVAYVFQCSKTHQMEKRSAALIQLQLEQDSGKSLHDKEEQLSLIDLNRAGVGLMEIVTAPDFKDGDDAVSFVRDLRHILVSIGTCDGKMQEGSLRVDANISLNRPGEELGTRTEVKNLNSLRGIKLAINYEIQRQKQILDSGGKVINETLSFDVESEQTVPMRDKEKILDYRFMPEPNLPPLVVYKSRSSVPDSLHSAQLPCVVVMDDVKNCMVELPEEKMNRLMTCYDMSLKNAAVIVRADLSELFEKLVMEYKCDTQASSSLVMNNFKTFLENLNVNWQNGPFEVSVFAEIVDLYHKKAVSGNSVTVLLEKKYICQHMSLNDIIEENELHLLTDTSLIENLVNEVVSRNPKMVKAYKRGKVNQLEVIHKRIMKKLEGKANSKTVSDLVKRKLDEA